MLLSDPAQPFQSKGCLQTWNEPKHTQVREWELKCFSKVSPKSSDPWLPITSTMHAIKQNLKPLSGLIPSPLFLVMTVPNLKRFCHIFSENKRKKKKKKKANSSFHFSLWHKKQKGILMTTDSLKSWSSLCAIKKWMQWISRRHYIKNTSPATLLQRCTLSIPKHYRFHKENVVCIILNTLQQMGIAEKKGKTDL